MSKKKKKFHFAFSYPFLHLNIINVKRSYAYRANFKYQNVSSSDGSCSARTSKARREDVKQVGTLSEKNTKASEQRKSAKPKTRPNLKSFKVKDQYPPLNERKTKVLLKPKSLPEDVQKRRMRNHSEAEKKFRQAKRIEYQNKVGWQERKGRHRHAHQARREKQLINYMNGLPLDFDMSDDD